MRHWTSPKMAHWRCGVCAMICYDAPDVVRVAESETRLNELLWTLTWQGQRMTGGAE